jgi:iron complex outermembrane recepter protein
MKTIIILIFSIAVSQIVIAQNTLNGKITSKNTNEKLSGASVYVPELNKGTSANANGEYSISGFGKGDFKIQVSFMGYQTKIETVSFSGNNISRDIQLEVESIELNEVVISGAFTTSQDESPQEIDVIKKSEMQQTGASTVMEVLTTVPGVNAITTGQYVSRPVIRGMSGNRILTVVDGVRFETQQWDDEHGIGVNEVGMDRIEIIKGPASLLYGSEAMGGVVHFIEEQPAAIGHTIGNFNASISSNNLALFGGLDVKGATDKYNWSINTIGKMLPDYYFSGYDFRAPNTRLNEFGGRGNFGINRKWGSTSLTYQFNQAYYGILDGKDIVKNPDGSIVNKDTAEADMFPSEIEAPYHSVMDNKISSKTILLAGASRFHITLGYQNNHRAEYEDNGTKEGYNYVDMTLQSATYDLKWYVPTWKRFSTIIGVQGMYQTNSNSSEAKTVLVPDATINDMGFVALTKFNLKRFNLTAGVRYDSRDLSTVGIVRDSTINMPGLSRSYGNVSGSIGANYNIEDRFLIRANFSTGYRTPNLNELMSDGVKLESQHYEIGNINFVKEQNNEIDVSANFNSKHFSIEIAGYLNNITNYIYIAPTGDSVISNLSGSKVPEYKYQQANAQVSGGEAGIDIHPSVISWAHLEVKGSTLTAIRTADKSYLPMMPADKIYSTLIFNFKEYKNFKNVFIRIGTVTTFDQNKVAANEQNTPGYTLLNASIGATRKIWKFNKIDIILAVNNALDKVYMDHMSRLRTWGISNPGRNIVLSLNIPFDMKDFKKAN